MIVLDASVLIAHTAADVHAEAAQAILDTDQDLCIHPLTRAEFLVGPVRIGRESEAERFLDRLDVAQLSPPPDEPLALARLRVATGLRFPDCCVLVSAIREGASLATFDKALARAARARGIAVLGEEAR